MEGAEGVVQLLSDLVQEHRRESRSVGLPDALDCGLDLLGHLWVRVDLVEDVAHLLAQLA